MGVPESSPSEGGTRLRARVWGRVQGVFFRSFTKDHARRLGLVGWVRNLPHDTVEVVAEGPRSALEQLLVHLHQGPPDALVTQVDVEWDTERREFGSFRVR